MKLLTAILSLIVLFFIIPLIISGLDVVIKLLFYGFVTIVVIGIGLIVVDKAIK